ncbi:WD40 repeat domain-containing protein [Mycobacterium sp. GA-2829]|uniref:WD40 repeat domain-containing protein n=1 Tax=Mycobacterium sp. GA-2829 TaxID=1772283 RepID=UPI00073FB20F|nr:YncE family protein [Mycobacterium sp. GA-2829]KUI39237.1 hypothetical protein AU194_14490 [Mycobacterium sp. GA-2829]
MEPYQWLGAGAVALGLGIAVANGTGVAYAHDESGPAPSPSSSQDARDNDENAGTADDNDTGDENDDAGEENDTGDESGDLDTDDRDTDDLDTEDLDTGDDLDTDVDTGGLETESTQHTLTLVEEAPAPVLTPAVAEMPAVEVEPMLPESPVSEVLPELIGDDTGPQAPTAPAAPALSEIAVAAYRPENQRGASAAPVALQTTGESAPSGNAPLAAAATPSGVVDRVEFGSGLPYAVIASPDGRRVFVITMTGPGGTALPMSTVHGIDTATNRRLGDPVEVGYVLQSGFSTSAKPYAFSPDGKKLYVSAIGQGDDGRIYNRIVVIDAVSGQVAGDAIDLGNTTATGLVVSPDGRRLYTANTDSTVTVIDLQHDNIQVATIPIGVFAGAYGSGTLDIVISQNDAQTVYVADYAERAVYVIDPATSTADPDPILTEGYPMALALSPDGAKLFISTMTFEPLGSTTNQASLTVVDTATKSVVVEVDFGDRSTSPATNGVILVSPDGRYVYTESSTNTPGGTPSGTLWKIDTTTGAVHSLVSGVFPSPPVLSPDGTRLYIPTATVVGDEAQMAIGVVSTADGTMLSRIAIDPGALTSAVVSPDGKRLYLGQMVGSLGGDPTSLSGQLAVVDTGTSNAVTPPRAVNPITLIVRSVANAVRASVEAIAHAMRQTVSTVTRALDTLNDSARGSIVGFGQQVTNAVQSVVQAARNVGSSFGGAVQEWARDSLNFAYGVGQVVQAIPDAVVKGLQQAQRDTQKRLDNLSALAKTAEGGLARVAQEAKKVAAPMVKRIEGYVNKAKAVVKLGWVFVVYDLLFNGPKVS